jgi:hypothetical protein
MGSEENRSVGSLDRMSSVQITTGKLTSYYTINCPACDQYLEYTIDIISYRVRCHYCKKRIDL